MAGDFTSRDRDVAGMSREAAKASEAEERERAEKSLKRKTAKAERDGERVLATQQLMRGEITPAEHFKKRKQRFKATDRPKRLS